MGVLAVLAVVSYFHDVPLPGNVRFDAGMALALVAVVTAGPLAALAIDAVPVLLGACVGRERLVRLGTLANLSAFGWKAIAAALLLTLGPAHGLASLPWLLGAAAAQALVNLVVSPGIYGVLWQGRPVRVVVAMLAGTLPAAVLMLSAGALTAILMPALGLGALALFAAIAVVPQSALTEASRPRLVARLAPDVAARRYANAIAVQLELTRAERRHLAAVTGLAARRSGDPAEHIQAMLADTSRASLEAGHAHEWFDGRGGPAGLGGEVIPAAARIAAVAQTWAALTARGGPQLSHAAALGQLQNVSGSRLDPRVVAAAVAVAAEERITDAEAAPEPRLHRLGVPASVRRALAGAA